MLYTYRLNWARKPSEDSIRIEFKALSATRRIKLSGAFRNVHIWEWPEQRHHAPVIWRNYRRRTRVIAMLCQGIGTSRKNSIHALKFSKNYVRFIVKQRRAAQNSRRTFGEVHQGLKCPRHIGDTSAMFSTCLCKHRRCIFYVIISRIILVIHRHS